MDKAVATLVQLLDSTVEGTRLRAATALFDRARDSVYSLDMAERLAALEERARERGTYE